MSLAESEYAEQRAEVEPLALGQRRDRLGLGLAVQDLADQAAGVDAVLGLRDGAQRAGQPEPAWRSPWPPRPASPSPARPAGRRRGASGPGPGCPATPWRPSPRRRPPRRWSSARRPCARRRRTAPSRGPRARCPGPRGPTTRNLACCQANRPMSRAVKKSRAYRPRARWKIDAPCMTVLSTSKNAAACGSSGTCSAASTSAAAADASPGDDGASGSRSGASRRRDRRSRTMGREPTTVPLCQTSAVANVADLVRAAAARRPGGVALVHLPDARSRTTTTWAALDADVDATAAGLRTALGLHAGDRVALAMANTPAFVTSYFAVLRAGLVAVPINTGYTAPEIARLLAEADVKVVLCDDSTLAVVEEAVAGSHRVHRGPGRPRRGDRRPGAARPRRRADRGGEDLAVLMFTSGTSGRPRAAMLSHRALLDQPRAVPGPRAHPDGARTTSCSWCCRCSTSTGSTPGWAWWPPRRRRGVLVERFDPAGTLGWSAAEGVTNIPGAPPMYVAWAGARRLRRRCAASGCWRPGRRSAAARRARAGADRGGHHVHEGYGLTETAPVVTSTLASPGRQGRVDRPAAPRRRGAAGRRGRRRRPTTTTPARSGSAAPTCSPATGRTAAAARTPDGWWATGDVAYADEDGDLFLVDRRKELVIVSGFNVYPREVEDALAEHPDVAEVAVIGVPHPYTGEAVKAFVVPAGRCRPDSRRTSPRTRPPGWPGSSVRPIVDPRRRRCRTRPPARSPRAGCARRRAAG